MVMNDTRRAELMAYCHLDTLSGEEQVLLDKVYLAAVGYLADAGVETPEPGTPAAAQYDLLIDAMVLDDWDTRGSQIECPALKENPSWRRRLNQLKTITF